MQGAKICMFVLGTGDYLYSGISGALLMGRKSSTCTRMSLALAKWQVFSNQRGGMRTMLSSLTGLRVRVPAALPVLTRSGSKRARNRAHGSPVCEEISDGWSGWSTLDLRYFQHEIRRIERWKGKMIISRVGLLVSRLQLREKRPSH